METRRNKRQQRREPPEGISPKKQKTGSLKTKKEQKKDVQPKEAEMVDCPKNPKLDTKPKKGAKEVKRKDVEAMEPPLSDVDDELEPKPVLSKKKRGKWSKKSEKDSVVPLATIDVNSPSSKEKKKKKTSTFISTLALGEPVARNKKKNKSSSSISFLPVAASLSKLGKKMSEQNSIPADSILLSSSAVNIPESNRIMMEEEEGLEEDEPEGGSEGYAEGQLEGEPGNSQTRSLASGPITPCSKEKNKKRVIHKMPPNYRQKRLTYVLPTSEEEEEQVQQNPVKITDVFAIVCKEGRRQGCLVDTVETVDCRDSRLAARTIFQALISPATEEIFFRDLWEKKPAYILNRSDDYHQGLFSSEELYRILKEHELYFSKNIDVTTYIDGKRETHNPCGIADPYTVREYFKEGCSIRLLNPQTYSYPLWQLNSRLQDFFHSCVGSNVYLTPAGTQGFAPHYDDIEAFVLQIEGKKRWKLYKPRTPEEYLPRVSSRNFTKEEIGRPILDVILHPGDLLYFPRGFLHQAESLPDSHSLHITVSTYQKHTLGDLVSKVFTVCSETIEKASSTDLKRGLPVDLWSAFSPRPAGQEAVQREAVQEVISMCLKQITPAAVAGAVDKVFEGVLHDCLPPCLTEAERCLSRGRKALVTPAGISWEGSRESVQLGSRVKLTRHGAARVSKCGAGSEFARLVYNISNSREYHANDLQALDITPSEARAVEHIISAYPKWTAVHDLPLPSDDDKIDLACELFDKGLLLLQDSSTS